MARNSHRIEKRFSSSRATAKQRSRFGTETAASGGASLQRMVDEATYGLREDCVEYSTGSSQSKGKQRSQETGAPSTRELQHSAYEDRPFPLMSLPAEIRNEIYRACLTRPYNILLSRREPPQILEPLREACEPELHVSDDGLEEWEDLLQPSLSAPGRLTRSSSHRALRARARARDPFHPQRTASARLNAQTGSSVASNSSNSSIHSPASSIGTSLPRRDSGSEIQPPVRFYDKTRSRRPQDEDPLIVKILRVSKQVYEEARSILYSENHFTLDLDTAQQTLTALHQRSRRQIKYVELEIPCYNEILERFQECVRLSLRYCWGLKTFVIHMPFTLPGADGSGTTGNTTVYANGFDILRWLPRHCEVVLKGNICTEISTVVVKNANLARTLDDKGYARRQLISNETERT